MEEKKGKMRRKIGIPSKETVGTAFIGIMIGNIIWILDPIAWGIIDASSAGIRDVLAQGGTIQQAIQGAIVVTLVANLVYSIGRIILWTIIVYCVMKKLSKEEDKKTRKREILGDISRIGTPAVAYLGITLILRQILYISLD